MSKYFMSKNKGKTTLQEEPEIQHVTYEENQAARPSPSVASSSSKYVSHSFQESEDLERPVKPERSFVDTPTTTDCTLPKTQYNPEQPPSRVLRHTGKLPDRSICVNDPFGSGRPDRSLNDYIRIQQDIREGRLEKTLPQKEEKRPVPLRPSPWNKKGLNYFSPTAADPSSQHYQANSPSPTTATGKRPTNFTQRISAGKCAMAEVSEQLTNDVKNSLARFSLTRRESSGSDGSFMCRGESSNTREREINSQALAAWKNENREEKQAARHNAKPEKPKSIREWEKAERKKRGNVQPERTDPRIQLPSSPRVCGKCRKPGLQGMRRFCYPCEQELTKPQHPPISAIGGGDFPSDFFEVEEKGPTPPPKDYPRNLRQDVKPTPPLKDHPLARGASKFAGSDDYSLNSLSHEPELTISRVISRRPQIVEGFRGRHVSMSVEVEEVEPWRRWQTPRQREEFNRAEGDVGAFDDCFQEGEEVGIVYVKEMSKRDRS